MQVELARFIDALPGLAWSALPDGRADFLNQRWLDYAGMTAPQAVDWGWLEAIHPHDRDRLTDVWRSCLASGTSAETEGRMRRYDGAYRWFLFCTSPLRDEKGNISRWLGTNIDVEDRRRVEDALRASELSWRQIVDNIPGLVATMGTLGEVEFLNRQTLEYFGKTSEELKNWSLIGAVHPADLPHVIEARAKAIETGQIYEVEHRCRRADGVYRWFQVRGLPVRNADGAIDAWYLLLTDIDVRKSAEEAIRRSEAFLAEGQRLSSTGSFCWNRTTDEITWSYELHNIYDLEVGVPVTLELIRTRVHPEDIGLIEKIESDDEACSNADNVEWRWRLLMPDCSIKYLRGVAHATRNRDGQLEYIAAIQDVTQHHYAQADLQRAYDEIKKSEAKLRQVIDTIPTLSWCNFPDGSNEFLSSSWHAYTGLSPEQSHGWGWKTAFHPDDLPPLLEKWGALLISGEAGEIEARLRRHDGAYRWFLIRAQPLREDGGKIVRWYGTSTDIDDHKRAVAQVEQAYLRLAEAQQLSKTGSFITDLLADEHNWSEEAFRIFEFDPATKVNVQMIRDMVHPEDLPSFDSVIAQGMTGKDVTFDFRILTSRGAVKHVRGMARVMEQVAGRPLFIGALQDVTERRVAEEALNRARSELAHVARVTTLNALTASIAHEVNQPLSGIITNASTCLRMLNGDPPNLDGARETVRRTLRDGNRAKDVITRLRALFSKKELTLESLDLNEAAQEVIALSLSDLQRNRVVLKTELADGLPQVIGDRVQLQQVILNLIRNATDAMTAVDDRPRELLIKTENDEDRMARVSVTDAGSGFETEAAEKLFEVFYTTKPEGMGIGLSVSRSIIEAHHGRLWATSNDGPGVTFSFSIPYFSEPTPARDNRRL